MYLGNKEQALEICKSNGKSIIDNTNPPTGVTDLSSVFCANVTVTAGKTIKQMYLPAFLESILPQIGTSIRHRNPMQGIIVVLSRAFVYLNDYTTKRFLKVCLSNSKNKEARKTLWTEKILSYDFANVTVYVTLRYTVSSNRGNRLLTQNHKKLSILDVAGVLDLDLPLYCSIKFPYFLCILDDVETTWTTLDLDLLSIS